MAVKRNLNGDLDSQSATWYSSISFMGNKNTQDLTGCRFGRLLVLREAPKRLGCGRTRWISRCDCGNESDNLAQVLLRQKAPAQSCGCLAAERVREALTVHGMTHHPVFSVWLGMHTRCYNKNDSKYDTYGGRGITICERWRDDFAAFFSDMGDRPSKNHSIDRIDNEKGYEPGNCRWATRNDQARNKRNTVMVTLDGITRPAVEWASILGMSSRVLRKRLTKGWSAERALTPPTKKEIR